MSFIHTESEEWKFQQLKKKRKKKKRKKKRKKKGTDQVESSFEEGAGGGSGGFPSDFLEPEGLKESRSSTESSLSREDRSSMGTPGHKSVKEGVPCRNLWSSRSMHSSVTCLSRWHLRCEECRSMRKIGDMAMDLR